MKAGNKSSSAEPIHLFNKYLLTIYCYTWIDQETEEPGTCHAFLPCLSWEWPLYSSKFSNTLHILYTAIRNIWLYLQIIITPKDKYLAPDLQITGF